MEDLDLKLLYLLQYEFPIDPRPFDSISEKLGLTPQETVRRVRELSRKGVLKRIGFYPNYVRGRSVGALVGCRVDNVDSLAKILLGDRRVTHNYLRDHKVYNVWFTYRAGSRKDIISRVEDIMRSVGSSEYVILFSKRVYRLSVKYDLTLGVSRAKEYLTPSSPPSPEELGLDHELVAKLSRGIPLEERPFRGVAAEHEMSEEEVADALRELSRKGAISDYGAILNSEALGFRYNAMVVVDSRGEGDLLCERLAREYPYATHIVLREVPKRWSYDCYFVVQARSRKVLESIIREALEVIGDLPYLPILSVKNLKPR